MGLLSEVLTSYRADVSDHKAKLKELSGAERALMEQQIAAAEARNKSLDGWTEKLAHAGLAFGALSEAAEFFSESMKEYAENLKLEAAAGSTNVESLSDAFNGLITRHQALTFAAQAQHGVLKLTQAQMETVGRATVALSRAGFDQTEVFGKLQDAVVSLKTRGLDDYGIAVKEGKNNTETLTNIIDALNQKAKESNGLMETQAEAIQRTSVAWANFKEDLHDAAAQMVQTLPPLENLQKQAELMDKFWTQGHVGELTGDNTVSMPTIVQGDLDRFNGTGHEQARLAEAYQAAGEYWTKLQIASDKIGGRIEDWAAHTKKAYDNGLAKAKALAEQRKALSNAVAKSLTDDLVKQLTQERIGYGVDQRDPNQIGLNSLGVDLNAQIDAIGKHAGQDSGSQRQAILEKTFGKIEDFEAYRKAFDTLTGAVGSAYESWVTGSDSASHAVKKFLADMIMGFGKQMAIEAIKYEAYALASIVPGPFFNPAAAAGYAATGAAFAAGAITAGIVSHELGGGASTPRSAGGGSSSGPAPGISGPSGGGNGGGGGPVIVIGDSFDDATPRMRQLKARQLVNRALGGPGVEDS